MYALYVLMDIILMKVFTVQFVIKLAVCVLMVFLAQAVLKLYIQFFQVLPCVNVKKDMVLLVVQLSV
jgi:hypothetical protein